LYCEWLTEKVNATLKDSYKLVFRLPTQKEWIKAAKGKLEQSIYSWGGYRLHNAEGAYMCNCLLLVVNVFQEILQENLFFNE
jgi:formylglycine-generating enzyme